MRFAIEPKGDEGGWRGVGGEMEEINAAKRQSALLVERGAERSQRRLLSCHIISGRAVNNGPLRPPGPLHSRMQVGARLNSPLGNTVGNNGDIVRHPVLSLGPGRRLLLNWLYSARAK